MARCDLLFPKKAQPLRFSNIIGTIYVFTTAEGFGLFKNTSKNQRLERPVEGPRETQGRPK